MRDTISRQAAIDALDKEYRYGSDIDRCGLSTALDEIEDIPAADVVPVVHANWIDTENYYRRWRCSACSGHTKEAHPQFCPFCGAKMDGEREEK